jgi:hypothetical protein
VVVISPPARCARVMPPPARLLHKGAAARCAPDHNS